MDSTFTCLMVCPSLAVLALALAGRPDAKKEQFNRPTELPVISTNEQLPFLISINLTENALKYNESPTPAVSVTYQPLPEHHRICVKDNGIGIPLAYHHRIFELFYRLHDKGTGLGLAKNWAEKSASIAPRAKGAPFG